MRETTLIKALDMHDSHINALRAEFRAMQKALDKSYAISLTHVMMWDCLMELLEGKNVFTKTQFDEALHALGERTKAAMEAEAAKKAQAQVTVVSDEPAIPVVK